MKFIYFGSSEFSCFILDALCLRGNRPCLIISQPDRPRGRGLKVLPTRVSSFAEEKGIPLVKPQSLRDGQLKKRIEGEGADFFAVADYGKVLPAGYLSLRKTFPLGVHPSLLPAYRGPAPINWAIINGDKETGVTVFKVNERIDAGEIILQEKIKVEENDNFFTLTDKLALAGGSLLLEAARRIKKGDYTLRPQDEASASFAPKLKKEDGRINWKDRALQINNLVRGTLGWPSAYTFYNGKLLKILKVETAPLSRKDVPGTIVKIDREGIYLATGEGILKIKRLKPQGKKEMGAWDFVCGYRVKGGEKFT